MCPRKSLLKQSRGALFVVANKFFGRTKVASLLEMHSFMSLLLSLLVPSLVTGLNPLVIKGNAFFDSVSGQRFYIRGVDYQVSPHPQWFEVLLTEAARWIFRCEL